jgi:hypothetical protein
MIAQTLMAFIIVLPFGESQKDVTDGKLDSRQVHEGPIGEASEQPSRHHKWQLCRYSSVFLELYSRYPTISRPDPFS